MKFARTPLNGLVDQMRLNDAESVAKSENYRWETRVSPARMAAFEAGSGAVATIEDFDRHHKRYVKNHVNILSSRDEPAPFTAANGDALTPCPNEREYLVRVEDFTWCIPEMYGFREEESAKRLPDMVRDLKAAYDGKDGRFETFFSNYLSIRKPRPMFAAFEGDLGRFPDWRTNWAHDLPVLLGLAHLSASPDQPRLVALMRYPAKRVLDEKGRVSRDHRFAAPTVIDHLPNPWFFPSPLPNAENPINYGRAVNLKGRGTLVCEIIHRSIDYRLDDIQAVAVLTTPIDPPIATVRMAHVEQLRRQKGYAAFAAD